MKEQDKFILDIKRLGINGEGIGFYKKLAVFVDNAIPGEGHNVCVTKVLKQMAFAETFEIKHASPDRIEIACPYYKECGGCNVSHIKYNRMLELKRHLIIETLNRYTSINSRSFEIKPTVRSNDIYNYRNRSLVSVKKVQDGYATCLVNPKTNELVTVGNCLLQNEIINSLNEKIAKLAYDLGVTLYIPKFNRGVLRYISIRLNEKNQALVCLICGEKNSKIKTLANEIIKLDNVVGVYENFNTSKKEGIHFGEEMNLLEGEDSLIYTIGNTKTKLYPNTYLPYNASQINNLYEIVLKACKLSKQETVLLPHSKTGSLAIYLSKLAKEVIGIEYNKNNVALSETNAKLNKVNNVKFSQGDVKSLLPKVLEDKEIDIVVLEANKLEIDEEVNIILENPVKKVIIISNNSANLVKGLERLTSKYNINAITPIDMAPQTSAIEMVVQLTIKK